MNKNFYLLDCTLRDGGYYNNWNFDNNFINNYLISVSLAKIDYVEIGFRFLKHDKNLGELAYTKDSFLKKIKIPKNIKIAVMINGEEYKNQINELNKKFIICKNSKIDLVRIAININKVDDIKEIAKHIKSKNYKVAINLMQSNQVNKKKLIEIIETIKQWNCCDILYFADSLGAMDHVEVRRLSKIIKSKWNKHIGFHSHDNRSLALSNSLEAIKNSINFIDSTILGMGRGAGNLQTEKILFELNRLKVHNGNVKGLSVTLDDFSKLKSLYNWGSNVFYHFAALNNIHPTYIQTLLSDQRYTDNQIYDSIDFLSKNTSLKFDKNKMMNSIYLHEKIKSGKWNATDWLKNKKVLIIGSGPSVEINKKKILKFIKENNPKVIFLNINKAFDEKLGIATIACHEARILGDIKMYKKLRNPIIIPFSNLNPYIQNSLKNKNIYDYSLTLKDDSFKINSNGCILKWPLAIAYALAITTQANAKKIYLAGFDGYSKSDTRQDEMNEIFNYYSKIRNKIKINMITKSSYKIK